MNEGIIYFFIILLMIGLGITSIGGIMHASNHISSNKITEWFSNQELYSQLIILGGAVSTISLIVSLRLIYINENY